MLDSIFCMDAMSPEFKKANDILLRIVKMNDRTDGLPHTRLAELNKAFKANDAKAARTAFDKLKPLLAKGDKDLQDGLTEARSKFSESSQKAEQSKAAFTFAKSAVALFDKFRKAIDGVKAKPAAVSKLSAYADKLKAYGDFSKRIAQMSQMVAAKKDIAKQCDMLAAACDKGKAKADKERAKAEKDYKAANDRVSVFKEMEKIRSKKIAEFAKEKEDVRKLGQALPNIGEEREETPSKEEMRRKLVDYLNELGNTAMKAKADYDAQRAMMQKAHVFDARDYFSILMSDVIKKSRDIVKTWNYVDADELIRDLEFIKTGLDLDSGLTMLQNIGANNKDIKPLLRKPINFIQKVNRLCEEAREKKYGGSVSLHVAERIQRESKPIRAAYYMMHDPKIKSDIIARLKQAGINDPIFFMKRLREGYLAF